MLGAALIFIVVVSLGLFFVRMATDDDD